MADLAAVVADLRALSEAPVLDALRELAEVGRGLARDNAAARVYSLASGRGTLGESVRGWAETADGGWELVIEVGGRGTPAEDYARAQELGAVIRPVRARYLAIPTDEAIRGGVQSPRQLDRPRFVPRRGGGWLVFQGGRLLFVLHPGPVRLPAKRFAADAFGDITAAPLDDAVDGAIRRALGAA